MMSQLPRRLRPDPLPEVSKLLSPIRDGFLHLHKALIDRERAMYEVGHGAIPNNAHFLQLLLNDPFFAWLRPFGQFVVQIDEALETEVPLSLVGAHALLDQARGLLRSSESGNSAEQRYYAALQGNDQIVLLHADLKRQLNNAGSQ